MCFTCLYHLVSGGSTSALRQAEINEVHWCVCPPHKLQTTRVDYFMSKNAERDVNVHCSRLTFFITLYSYSSFLYSAQ